MSNMCQGQTSDLRDGTNNNSVYRNANSDVKSNFDITLKKAQLGDSEAQFSLGYMYYEGTVVIKDEGAPYI